MLEVGRLANLNADSLTIMLLMTMRISALLLSTPIFGSRTVPVMTKIGIAIILSFVLLPTAFVKALVPQSFGHLVLAMGVEIAVGLLAGFAVTLLFASLQMVATLAGVQMGFGFSNTVDITYTGQSPVLDHLFTGMATLIFLTGNFHHQFLIGIQRLFETVPTNDFSFYSVSPAGVVALSANIFVAAVRIALPLLGALVLTDIALGVLARTSPQLNVFFVGMPVKLALGIFALIVMLPFVGNGIEGLFSSVPKNMAEILR